MKNKFSTIIVLFALTFILNIGKVVAQSYCTPSVTSSNGFMFLAFNFSNDSKITGGVNHSFPPYGTGYTANVASSSGTLVRYHVRSPYISTYSGTQAVNYYYTVYADWNQDGDFTDSNERIYNDNQSIPLNTSNNFPQNISVPLTALSGSTRLRFIINKTTSPASCGPVVGQVFDYKINIPANAAPVLNNTGTPVIPGIKDVDQDPAGITLNNFVSLNSPSTVMITDPDDQTITNYIQNAPRGIAIYDQTVSNGKWQYKIAAGAWTDFGAVSASNALLLMANETPSNSGEANPLYATDTKIRFLPTGGAATPTFSFRAWDATTGENGTYANVSTNGTTTAFSSAVETASINVTENQAPVLDNTGSPLINALTETQTNTNGISLDEFVASTSLGTAMITDADDAALGTVQSRGIAIYGQSATNGTWQYKVGAGSWTDFGSVSVSNSLLLIGDAHTPSPPNNRIRFVPTGPGTASFSFYAWDATTGTNAAYGNITTTGGSSAYSSAAETASVEVLASSSLSGPKMYFSTDNQQILVSEMIRSSGTVAQSENLLTADPHYTSGDVEIDVVNSKIYWIDYSTGLEIRYSSLTGTNEQVISPSGPGFISGLALSPTNLYYLDYTLGLVKSNLDGTNPTSISGGAGQIDKADIGWNYDLEYYNNYLFVTIYSNTNSDYRIYRTDVDGNNAVLLYNTINEIRGIYAINNTLYWTETDYTDSFIKSVAIAGGTVTDIATLNSQWSFDIVVDDANSYLYYTSNISGFTSLLRMPIAGGIPTKLQSFGTLNINSFTFIGGTPTWTGTQWINGPATTNAPAIIEGDYTSVGNIAVGELTIRNNATVVFQSGNNLTVNGKLTVENGSNLTLDSNANLLQTTEVANSGVISIKRDTAPLKLLDYVLWSSPVAGQQLQSYSPLTLSNRFYTYNSGTNLYNGVTSPSANTFAAGTGYLIRMPNDHPTTPTIWTGTFTGIPTSGAVSVPVTSGTYNAIGNPYPSTLDTDAFIDANGITEALYFWRKTNNSANPSYATYTKAGGVGTANSADPLGLIPNGVIQVGQGFIAKATSNAVSFTNAMRIATNGNQFLRTKITDKSRIWLNLTNASGFFSQTMVAYMDGATSGIDAAIDGRYFNDSKTALTSIINNEEFTIQGRSLPFDASDVVSLGFKTEIAGDFTLAIDHTDGLFASGQKVFLKDNLTNTVNDLSTANYKFTSDSGVFNDRFALVYQKTLGTNQEDLLSNQITVYKQNDKIRIDAGKLIMKGIKVYDLNGRLLLERKNINANQAVLSVVAAKQALLITITSNDGIVIIKKIIN